MTNIKSLEALADPTRRRIISLLGEHERTVAQVAGHFDITRAAVKKHLLVLEDGGVVVSIADPKLMFTLVDNTAVEPVAEEAEQRLRRVIRALGRSAEES